MAIYHFGKTFEQINASLRSCPTISRFMNEEQLTSARRHLRNLFPKFEAVRNAVAHSAESLKTREKIEEHSVRGSVQIGGFNLVSGLGRTLVQDFLVGREFANTYEGKLQSYEMSEDTLEGMYMICLELYEAFDKVETETKRMASHSKGGFMQPEAT